MRYYLDESGTTGDVAKVGQVLDFGGQPIFVLAAVGVADHAALAIELRRLAEKHAVLGGELSSRTLVDKPVLAGDLADYLRATDSPVFIEMMDKRFLMIINLMNCLLLPPVPGFDEGGDALFMRKVLIELMAASLPDTILLAYARACETRLRVDLRKAFPELRKWTDDPALGELRTVLREMVADAFNAIEEAEEPDGHIRFLPLPDRSVTGRSISMLPGLSALTNIYARINKQRRGSLAGTTLVHDEHMLFGGILLEAKALMEELSTQDIFPDLPHADYRLRERSELAFARSDDPGIQAADVLAGFVMRFFRDARAGSRPSAEHRSVMVRMMALTDQPGARGINMVAPDALLGRAGFR